MKSATWGLWYWPAFLITSSLAFLIAEIIALATNVANTLSDYAWLEMGLLPLTGKNPVHTAGWFLSLGVTITVMAWLIEHIWFVRFR